MGEHPRKDVQKGTFQELLEEIKEYDGWGHDSGRNWRNADRWEKEGFQGVKTKFGERAFGLHHRFLGRLGPLGRMFKMAGVLMGHGFLHGFGSSEASSWNGCKRNWNNHESTISSVHPKFTKDGLPLTH